MFKDTTLEQTLEQPRKYLQQIAREKLSVTLLRRMLIIDSWFILVEFYN